MSDELEPLILDRKLRDAASIWVRWRRALGEQPAGADDPFPFQRVLTSRTTFLELESLVGRDPLAPYLRRWVYRLSEQRINWQALAACELERRSVAHVIDAPERAQLDLARMLAQALGDRARRAAWLASFVERAAELARQSAALWERRAEIARRMGLESPDEIETCNAQMTTLAERTLALTQDAADEFRTRELAQYVTLAMGDDFCDGWPARLSLRSLADLFRGTRLLDGVPLDPGPFPEALSGASFVRGLRRLGAAWSTALAPKQQPFAIAHDPYGLRRRQVGALFAGLALEASFAQRMLGLTPKRARERSRAVARVYLLDVRSAALRVLLRSAALAGHSAFKAAFESGVERVHGLGLDPSLAGALFRLEVDDTQRLAGALLAAEQYERLVNEHDEDWFRNPRAVERLRAEAALSPEVTASTAELESGAALLARSLRALIG